jgi:hypothetical protein
LPCCATSKPFSFVFCDNCDPALDLARCSICYGKFSSKLKRRLPEIASSMGAEPHLEPVMKALLDTECSLQPRELIRDGCGRHA